MLRHKDIHLNNLIVKNHKKDNINFLFVVFLCIKTSYVRNTFRKQKSIGREKDGRIFKN